jgi:hypothetical protein
MSIHQIRLYDLFRNELRLPDDKAAAFVIAVGDLAGSEAGNEKHLLATKDDINFLKEDMNVLKVDMNVLKVDMNVLKDDIHSFELKVTNNIHSLELRIERSKTDIYKAMFWTGIAQLIAILGGVLAIVKFMK